jgi:hypothetical protein
MGGALPQPILKQLQEEMGPDVRNWPQELQDLVNPSIEARAVGYPQNGKIAKRLNTECEYFWAKDVCGQNPDHSRVEGLRYGGWDYATTDDVEMANEDVVKGRDANKKSKDGKGYSNEIRNGDLRLMKVPMRLWREIRKGHNIAALQTAYPQPYGTDGRPMTTASLTPGMHTTMLTPDQITENRRNAVVSDPAEDIMAVARGENARGNAAVAKIPKS